MDSGTSGPGKFPGFTVAELCARVRDLTALGDERTPAESSLLDAIERELNRRAVGTKRAWRAARAVAFDRGEYTLDVPAVTTGRWDKIAWCNHVRFHNASLRGFDDRKD